MAQTNKKITAIIIYSSNCDKKQFALAKKSVFWCDELILVNGTNGSFADWRNEGLKKAKGDWILYLDTDETISSELAEEIELIMMNTLRDKNEKLTIKAYAIPRRNYIFNKEFKYSGQYPDYQKRLFKKSALKEWTGEVHEEPVMKESASRQMGHLKNPIIHHKNITISQMIEKTNKWSDIEAGLMYKANHPQMNIFRFFSAGFREFWLRFVKQTCFLDGKEGVIYGIYQIYSRLISYSKLWEKQLSTIRT